MSKADAFTQAGKTAVLQNIQGTLQFLQRFPPFNQMEKRPPGLSGRAMSAAFFYAPPAKASSNLPMARLSISTSSNRAGSWVNVRTRPRAGPKPPSKSPPASVSPSPRYWGNGRPAPNIWRPKIPFCLQLNKLAFIKLFALSSPFRDFALRGVSSLLDQVNQQVQQKKPWKPSAPSTRSIPGWANWPCVTQ